MKFSREDLLEIETLVDPSTNTIITSDVTWEDGVGEIHNGFNMKAHMPEDKFEEALDSEEPGNYILEHYPADGTFVKGRLERLSVDEALCLVNDPTSHFFIPGFSIPHKEKCMKNNENKTIKLEDLEVETVYKDNSGHFFKLFYDEYAESPRLDDNVATILTWERDYSSPDENNDTFEEFAEKHGVDVSKGWNLDSVMDAMREEGYYVVPVYALHHGASRYSINNFHDKWDSCVVGVAFCKKQKGLPDNDDYLRMIIDREVKMYDAWANGEICGMALLSQNEEVLDESAGYLMLDDNRTETLKDMLSDVGVDIQDEYQLATREVSVVLK